MNFIKAVLIAILTGSVAIGLIGLVFNFADLAGRGLGVSLVCGAVLAFSPRR